MNAIVEINKLTKQYGQKKALDAITLKVREGGCFGLLGPNGAGKSTLMKLLTGILSPDSGDMSIMGLDAKTKRDEIISKTGYVPQEITLFETLSARRNLVFFGEMYGMKGEPLKRKVDEVLQQVGLADRAKDAVGTFSGGMKRRINIAASLLHDPKLLILDEPTVGIDPQSRNHIFEMISALKGKGMTILYSTHYMEEVEALCEDIAIMDHGKVIAEGTLNEVLKAHAAKAVYIESESLPEPPVLDGILKASAKGRGWVLETAEPLSLMGRLVEYLRSEGISARSLEIMNPSLESVFLKLTGSSLRD
ncbi:ABC transporter ATP-binding protein [Paenibacillus sp. CAU 1782]